jgi:hypothetical protein
MLGKSPLNQPWHAPSGNQRDILSHTDKKNTYERLLHNEIATAVLKSTQTTQCR